MDINADVRDHLLEQDVNTTYANVRSAARLIQNVSALPTLIIQRSIALQGIVL